MADVVTTWGLDWREFKRGTTAVEREARQAGSRVDREAAAFTRSNTKALKDVGRGLFGVTSTALAVGKLFQFMGKSAAKYNEETGRTSETMAAFSRANAQFTSAMGGQFSRMFDFSAIQTAVSLYGKLTSAISGTYIGASDVSAAFFSLSRSHVQEINAEIAAFDELGRKYNVIREAALKYEGVVKVAEARAKGGPGADSAAAQAQEQYRHRDALVAIRKEADPAKRTAAEEWENRLHAANVSIQQQAEEATRRQTALEQKLLDIEYRRTGVAALRRQHREDEAEALDGNLNREAAMARLEAERHKLTREDYENRAQTLSFTMEHNRDNKRLAAQVAALQGRNRSVESLNNQFSRAEIEVMQLSGLEEAAQLASIRLDYEERIRAVQRDQNLSLDEQTRAATELGKARDAVIRATGASLLNRAKDEYAAAEAQAIMSRQYRTVDAGMGWRSPGVFGPAGAVAPTFPGSGRADDLSRKADGVLKVMEAVKHALDEINRKTPSRNVGAVG
ncbi:MAG TPA: hypothetical protein PKE29_13380 [Phycisphaerales bacterium]|nr:hypothetical protein [Phycisphaerales bacterium]